MNKFMSISLAAALIVVPAATLVPTTSFAASGSCASGMESMIKSSDMLDPGSISSAETANVTPVSDCSSSDVSSALAIKGGTAVRKAIEGNAKLLAELQSQGYTPANVLGASMTGTAITIYVMQH